MLAGMMVDDPKSGRSKIRNRGIATFFSKTRLMERLGSASGNVVEEEVEQQGYPESALDGGGAVFRATLWPHPTAGWPRTADTTRG